MQPIHLQPLLLSVFQSRLLIRRYHYRPWFQLEALKYHLLLQMNWEQQDYRLKPTSMSMCVDLHPKVTH